MKIRNLVAKHSRKFNTAKVFDNRKTRDKRGYSKHKPSYNIAARNGQHH